MTEGQVHLNYSYSNFPNCKMHNECIVPSCISVIILLSLKKKFRLIYNYSQYASHMLYQEQRKSIKFVLRLIILL